MFDIIFHISAVHVPTSLFDLCLNFCWSIGSSSMSTDVTGQSPSSKAESKSKKKKKKKKNISKEENKSENVTNGDDETEPTDPEVELLIP